MKKLSLGFGLLALFQACSQHPDQLPFLGERQAVEKVVDGKNVVDTVYHRVAPFAYVNQDSVMLTEKDFEGKIYVADFFFTSCNTICPKMHRNMLKVYEKYKNNPDVKILSHTIDIKYDLPSRLKSYARKLGVSGDKWQFVHGSRDSIYNLAAKSYMVAAYEDAKDPQGLVHQGWFVLVDKNRHIRGAYDGTQDDQVEHLLSDMDILLKENEH